MSHWWERPNTRGSTSTFKALLVQDKLSTEVSCLICHSVYVLTKDIRNEGNRKLSQSWDWMTNRTSQAEIRDSLIGYVSPAPTSRYKQVTQRWEVSVYTLES